MATQVTPVITSGAVSNFGSGTDYAAGAWIISYVTGAHMTRPDWGWDVSFDDTNDHYVVTDSLSNIVGYPSQDEGDEGYATQALCTAAYTGTFVAYAHAGGTIGVYLSDTQYDDNSPGTSNPTFQLNPATPTLSGAPTLNYTPCGGVSSVALSWTSVSGATYNVYRSTASGSGYTLLANIAGTSYTDTSITDPTKSYYYVVTAVISSIESVDSNQVNVAGAPSVTPNVLSDAIAWFTS